jgi:hypothetical protein
MMSPHIPVAHAEVEQVTQERLIDHTSSVPLAVDDRGDVIELRGYTPNMHLGSYFTWRHVIDLGGWPS